MVCTMRYVRDNDDYNASRCLARYVAAALGPPVRATFHRGTADIVLARSYESLNTQVPNIRRTDGNEHVPIRRLTLDLA